MARAIRMAGRLAGVYICASLSPASERSIRLDAHTGRTRCSVNPSLSSRFHQASEGSSPCLIRKMSHSQALQPLLLAGREIVIRQICVAAHYTSWGWVTVNYRGLRNAVLHTPSILPANTTFLRAAGEGFEPSLTDPESVVLPLHHPARRQRGIL